MVAITFSATISVPPFQLTLQCITIGVFHLHKKEYAGFIPHTFAISIDNIELDVICLV